MIITYNTNGTPMGQNKAVTANPVTPTKILDPLGVGVQSAKIDWGGNNPQPFMEYKVPTQVIGLVPVFKCCDALLPCRAGFTVYHKEGELDYVTIRLVLNSVILGSVNINPIPTMDDAAFQAAIQALLPVGYTCTVISSNNQHRVVTIYAPSVTIGQDCGDLQVLSSADGGHYNYYNFTDASYFESPCDATCECKSYPADYISNPQDFALPVFASDECTDLYQNDFNSFLFSYQFGYDALYNEDFVLQEWDGIGWVDIAVLNTNQYGIAYNNNFFNQGDEIYCTNLNYQGYQIDWQKVYMELGEGLYRFKLTNAKDEYCYASPPFCLRKYDCQLVDGTVKFEAQYEGGTFGSMTQQGTTWKFCCTNKDSKTKVYTVPIKWKDSIRFFGFFGREQYETNRDFIKYATGEIKKVRDELIKTFDLRTDRLPLWLHQRLAAYGLMANKLFVSDYNRNNPNQNIKRFYIVADSGYSMDYKNYSRYSKVSDVKFKEGQQLIFKDNCC
jgi:hypothetical protein